MISMHRFALPLHALVEDNKGPLRAVTSSSLLTSDNLLNLHVKSNGVMMKLNVYEVVAADRKHVHTNVFHAMFSDYAHRVHETTQMHSYAIR